MKISVVDLDSVVYRSAAASETSTILVTHNPTQLEKEFKNRTEFKAILKSKNKLDKLEEYSITDQYVAEPLENCLHTIKRQIEKIKEATQADQMVLVVGGKDNFRDTLPLPKQYKGNRIDMHRPIHLAAGKQYTIERFGAEEINGEESDDAIIYKGYELKEAGYDVTVVTIDKDSLQADGLKLYDFTTDTTTFTEGHWFDIVKRKSGTDKPTGSGVGFLAYQMLQGDATDHYFPRDLVDIKYGVTKFHKDTRHCISPKDYLELVIKKYKEWYPIPVTYLDYSGKEQTKDWKELLDLYFKCCYMKRAKDDKSCSKEFFAKYDVNLNDH